METLNPQTLVLTHFLVGAATGALFSAATKRPIAAACVIICLTQLMGLLIWNRCDTADVCLTLAVENASGVLTWVLENSAAVFGWGIGFAATKIPGGKGPGPKLG